eukprot:11221870-Lingulodinium_polyedra.AAC.1
MLKTSPRRGHGPVGLLPLTRVSLPSASCSSIALPQTAGRMPPGLGSVLSCPREGSFIARSRTPS